MMTETEHKYSVPEPVFKHLEAAYETAENEETLYHLRETIQIAQSEVQATTDIGSESSDQ